MKKIIIAIFAVSFALISCKSNEDSLSIIAENNDPVAVAPDSVAPVSDEWSFVEYNPVSEEKKSVTHVTPEGEYIFKDYQKVAECLAKYCVYESGRKVLDYQMILVKKWTTKDGLIDGTIETTKGGLIYGTIEKKFDNEGNLLSEKHRKLSRREAKEYLILCGRYEDARAL